ncbi:hypothetical protein D9619_003339 [Psilocybe cf. subviscida]|uniref:Uncharacterized protein n=1 Tax=Psilocybe cf. subviscida TaxID=2480587 RepID=A0A8H5EUK0_9AGAR|nr:hypothetical protein D9619_003339 [Psilocybe cf. subviscida]
MAWPRLVLPRRRLSQIGGQPLILSAPSPLPNVSLQAHSTKNSFYSTTILSPARYQTIPTAYFLITHTTLRCTTVQTTSTSHYYYHKRQLAIDHSLIPLPIFTFLLHQYRTMPSLSQIASVLAIVAYTHVASCAPTPLPQFTETDNAYSGVGGNADGGDVMDMPSSSNKGLLSGLTVLNAFSHEAGAGGNADSGAALTGPVNSTATSNALNNLESSPGGTNVLGNGYTGAGGSSKGGSVIGSESGGLVNIFDGNAGNGGHATSGGVGSNFIPVPVAQAKAGVAPKSPISPLPLLHIIRARMDMD